MQLTFGGRVRAALIGGGASLILATATLAAPALAADQPSTTAAPQAIGPHTHQLHGTVKTGGSTGFTVTTERYGDVAVSFTNTTPSGHARGHGTSHGNARSYELASLADLKADERVVVQGRTSADGKTFVARRVHVLPAADGTTQGNGAGNDNGATTGTRHLVGNVTSATTTLLTLKLTDGTSQSVTVSPDTHIRPEGKTLTDLAVGARVTVVIRNGTATGIVVVPA